MTEFAWLIEAPGQNYLGARKLSKYEFFWTKDHATALRFFSKEQADMTMMAVRESKPELWSFAITLGEAMPVEHGWVGALRPAVTEEDAKLIEDARYRARIVREHPVSVSIPDSLPVVSYHWFAMHGVDLLAIIDRLQATSPAVTEPDEHGETDESYKEIGQAFMDEYRDAQNHLALADFICADSPSEIIGHLLNACDVYEQMLIERGEAPTAPVPLDEEKVAEYLFNAFAHTGNKWSPTGCGTGYQDIYRKYARALITAIRENRLS